MIGFPWSLYSHVIFIWCGEKQTSNTKYLESIKRTLKFQERNMSCERALNFDQWKTSPENCKSMITWLWLVYKFTKNSQIPTFLQVHSYSKEVSYISWQNTYPNLKTTCHIKLKIFLRTQLRKNLYSLQNISYLSLRL